MLIHLFFIRVTLIVIDKENSRNLLFNEEIITRAYNKRVDKTNVK